MGDIAPGTLYRSSSPIAVSQGERRFVADRLVKESGAVTVVNTSDCRFRFKGFEGFDDTHYATLNHVALNMGHNYPSDAFLEDVRNGFDFMAEFAGPYLVHGTQGVERTGYVCMMLEALMGAGREDILADYMRSYADYYQLSPDSEAWAALEDEATGYLMLCTGIWNEAALDTADLSQGVERYLTETVGLTPQQVTDLQAHLAGK